MLLKHHMSSTFDYKIDYRGEQDGNYFRVGVDHYLLSDRVLYDRQEDTDQSEWERVSLSINANDLQDNSPYNSQAKYIRLYFNLYYYDWGNLKIDNIELNDISLMSYNPRIKVHANHINLKIDHCEMNTLSTVTNQEYAIYSDQSYSNIKFLNSSIDGVFRKESWDIRHAININYYANPDFDQDTVIINNSSFNWVAYGLYKNSESPVTVKNTSFSNIRYDALRIHGLTFDDSLHVRDCQFNFVHGTAIWYDGNNSHNTSVSRTKIKNASQGIYGTGRSYLRVSRSLIADGGTPIGLFNDWDGQYGGSFLLASSTLSNNTYGMNIGRDNDSYIGNTLISNSIIKNDNLREIDHYGPIVLSYSAIEYGQAAIFGNNASNSYYALENCVTDGIGSITADGQLSPSSSAVDGGDPSQLDGNMPPGLGLVRSDIGIYGGPGNVIWGGEAIPEGEPVIDNIVDLPQDQGGNVGIQYSASIFDYQHTGYDISNYTFWREMDLTNSSPPEGATTVPNQRYYITNRDMYWEHIGEMDAQGFQDYGFTAPTLADSTADGIFWSKFIVIAHTNDDDVYFVSVADSGYSVDNIAPEAPQQVQLLFEDEVLTATWDDEVNPDIAFYDVHKNGEPYSQPNLPLFLDDDFVLGDSVSYTIRGVDIHDNIGDFSDPFIFSYGAKGDANWDGLINILDVTKILSFILFPEDAITDEEFWAGDFNGDEDIDIVDVSPVVDIILGGLLSSMDNVGGEPVVLLEENVLFLSSSRPITGVQIRMSEASSFTNLTNLNMATEGDQVVLYTVSGNVLQGDNIPLLSLESDAIIEEMILVDNMGERVSSALSVTEDARVPQEFAVHQNYPNPFNPSTLIKLDANKVMHTSILVYDIMGREIRSLVNKELQAGYHQFIWDGMDQKGNKVGSGVYFIVTQTPDIVKTMKATLIR